MIIDKKYLRQKRKRRVRAKISGSPGRPRFSLYRSHQALYAQFIDDEHHVVLVAKRIKGKNKEAARNLGKQVIELAKGKGISTIVFDRNGYRYHGVLHELAQTLREGGLQF
ncbi:MAG: 50S ribosomal protein L18 [bacterium]|nr:50S ribosomal protein L18 [bacterium]